MKRMALIATMAPPAAGTRRNTPSVTKLVEKLRATLDAQSLPNAPGRGAALLAIDVGDGRNIQVEVTANNASIRSTLESTKVEDEEHGGWIEDDAVNDAVMELAANVAEILQNATGWHVTSDHLQEFEPSGPCAKCNAEMFVWQEQCGACKQKLPPPREEQRAWAADYDAPYRKIITLATPEDDEITVWEGRARPVTIAAMLGAIRGYPGVRVTQTSVSAAAAVLHLGRTSREKIQLSLSREHAILGAPLQLDASPTPATLNAAYELAQLLQAATLWSPALEGPSTFNTPRLEPCGTCPACKVIVFRWQTKCRCGTELPFARTAAEELAHAFVEVMLEQGVAKECAPDAREQAETEFARRMRRNRPGYDFFRLDGLPSLRVVGLDALQRAYPLAEARARDRMLARRY